MRDVFAQGRIGGFPAVEFDGAEEALDVVEAVLDGTVEEAGAGELKDNDFILALHCTPSPGEMIWVVYIFRRGLFVRPFGGDDSLLLPTLGGGASFAEVMRLVEGCEAAGEGLHCIFGWSGHGARSPVAAMSCEEVVLD